MDRFLAAELALALAYLAHRWAMDRYEQLSSAYTGTRPAPIIEPPTERPSLVAVIAPAITEDPEKEYKASLAHQVYRGIRHPVRTAQRTSQAVWTGAKHLASWAADRPVIRHARRKVGKRAAAVWPQVADSLAWLHPEDEDAERYGRHSVWSIRAGRTVEALLAA